MGLSTVFRNLFPALGRVFEKRPRKMSHSSRLGKEEECRRMKMSKMPSRMDGCTVSYVDYIA